MKFLEAVRVFSLEIYYFYGIYLRRKSVICSKGRKHRYF